jgi:predicted RNA-binding protein YlxR (DUF448 family)
MSHSGAHTSENLTERKCLVSQESGPKAGLIRFVTSPDGVVVPDILEKLPGRGYYVTADLHILEDAVKRKVFARGAKTQISVPEDLIAQIDRQLARRVVDLVSIARKAGKAVTGFEKVKGWLAEGRAKVLLQANDGSARGKDKLWTPEGGRFFGCLTAQELGLAFGRGHAIHCALSGGKLSERVVHEAARLRGLREATKVA